MAWNYYNPNPSGGSRTTGGSSTGVTDFWNYRAVAGNVELRLTDVTFDSGYQFGIFSFDVALILTSGTVLAKRTLQKTWGVPAGFTHFGYYSSPRAVRFRVSSTYYTTANNGGIPFRFTLQMRYDGSITP